MPLRIALLSSWWRAPERGSGTAVAIDGLVHGLSELGHSVTLLPPRVRAPGLFLTRLLYNLELPARVRRHPFDLVVGFDWDGLLVRPRPGQRYVAAVKGVLADEARFEHGWPRLSLWFQSLLERRNARNADRVVTTSRYSRERLYRAYGLPPERVAAVPEGISVAEWSGAPARDAVRRPPTVLSVARQYPRKNTRTLVLAMAWVRHAIPGARLRVVGGGPELRSLKALAGRLGLRDAVTFLGPVADDAAVRREYFGADVFCLPSLQEGFGIAFLEAMAAGLPVVAGSCSAVPELVVDGETGLLVPPEDEQALADALIHLLTDAPTRRRMGERARKRAGEYEWADVARRFLAAAASEPAAPPPLDRFAALVLYDAACPWCCGWTAWLARRDRGRTFAFAPIDGPTARPFVGDAPPPDTMFVAEHSPGGVRVHSHARAVLRVLHHMGWPWRTASALRVLPAAVTDPPYRWLARRRMRLASGTCPPMPDTGGAFFP